MKLSILVSIAALGLAACGDEPVRTSEPRVLSTTATTAVHAVSSTSTHPVDTSASAEEQLLRQIGLKFSPENPEKLISVLRQTQRIARTSDPALSNMIGRYYTVRDARALSASTSRAAADESALSTSGRFGQSITVSQTQTVLPGGAKAYVMRYATGGAAIVVGSDADAIVLGAAIKTLRSERAKKGDNLQMDERVVLSTVGAGRLGPKLRAALESELARLSRAPVRQIRGVGLARSIDRALPPSKASDISK